MPKESPPSTERQRLTASDGAERLARAEQLEEVDLHDLDLAGLPL